MLLSLQNGWTALKKASVAGHIECVEVLLDKGAEINIQDKVSGVIIHCVHAMQHAPVVLCMPYGLMTESSTSLDVRKV